MNCGNCKYWTAHNRPRYNINGELYTMEKYYEGWVKDPLPGGYGLCENVYNSKVMCICDGEGITGELITHQSFGCLLYQTKESSANVLSEPSFHR